jgi:hypothetical protein
MKGLICPKHCKLFKVQFLYGMIVHIFKKQNLKKMLPNTLSMDVVLNKSLESLLWVCFILKMDIKNVKIVPNSALKRRIS